jgi:cell division protein FtsI/penicillin-binding protein 2
MGGKTGTSEVPGVPHQTVGWFIGFAPFDQPRYAVVVMQRRARGAEAATLARKALEKLM